MFTHTHTQQGEVYQFCANGYDFHVLHSILGAWTVYQMELEPAGKTFLDDNILIAHYPVAYWQLRAIVTRETAPAGGHEGCAVEGLAP
jgi:hypothetical protein